MKLYIDGSGGLAGDMFSAALISAGADQDKMLAALQHAAAKIGKAEIFTEYTHDGATRLIMHMNHNHGHLGASKARKLLQEIINDLAITKDYANLGGEILEVLIAAEKQAHKENTFLTDGHHHEHSHHHEEEAWLHEAQDILIDITGAIYGLMLLKAPTKATIIKPIALGGGTIKFSHGEMDAPSPATKVIFNKYQIESCLGPIQVELCTPTGASILAALYNGANISYEPINVQSTGKSRGGKDLDIPPLKIILEHA